MDPVRIPLRPGGALRRAAILAAVLAAGPVARGASLKLTLKDAVERALSDGTAARLAQVRVEETRARAQQSRAALLPRVDGQVGDSNEVINLATFGFTPPGIAPVVGPFNVFDARVTAAVRIVDLAARRRYDAARRRISVSEAEREKTDNDVAAAVATLYVSLQRSRAQVEETRANVDLFEKLLGLTRHQLEAGIATRLDTTRAQVQLAQQRQALLVARNQEDFARLALLHAIGADLSDDVEPADALAVPPAALPSAEEALAQARRFRPELRTADEELQAVRLAIAAEKAGRLPTLDLQAEGGYNGNYLNNVSWTRSIGAMISVPIFTGGEIPARVAQEEARLRELEIGKAEVGRQVEEEVRRAVLALKNSQSRVQVAEENWRLAQQELEFAKDRFANGLSGDIEVDNAQTALTSARDSRIAAEAERARAWFDMERATGTIRGAVAAGGGS
jgi:outer membrane protein